MALLLADLPGVEQVELDSPANVGDAWLAGPAGTPVPGLVRRPPEERVVLLAVRHVRRGAVHRDHPQAPVRPATPVSSSVLFSLEAPISRRGLPGRGRNAVLDRREP